MALFRLALRDRLKALLARVSSERYIRWNLRAARRAHRKRLKEPGANREVLERDLYWEEQEWLDWLRELEDKRLIEDARKMDVYLDDIPFPLDEENRRLPHFRHGTWGDEFLQSDSRAALRKAMRERGPIYRKETREVWDLRIKILTALTGLVGVIIGLVAVLRK